MSLWIEASRRTRSFLTVIVWALLAFACAADRTAAPVSGRDESTAPLPGAEPFTPELGKRLWAAYKANGPGYEPRTEHLGPDGSPMYINRLILEDSPYLIQHAHNPVNWFPWGPEAFDKARREDKPVFLSIGYSTCHWCHVMEKESFDTVEVARLLNEGFVAIKVDRESRPDVDEIYMTAVQLMTGSGGWPMSTLLTANGKPFFGGTYIPRDAFMSLLRRASQAWQEQRPQIIAQADQIAASVRRITAAAGEATEVGEEAIAAAVRESIARHDGALGGFSSAPKFPHEPELLFLLARVLRTGDKEAMAAVEISLDHMARGGIYDQVGGGFHRYSTDERWLVPHFEKMLYNQAHLSRAYLEAYRISGNPLFERVARQTLDYVLRDMTSPAGGFYSATDADSVGGEGEFFLWTPEEIRAALAPADAEFAIELFGVTEGGNFEGKTILNLPKSLPKVAAERHMTLEALFNRVDEIRQLLYEVRERRLHPLRDDKIITAWNAMMITSLARAGDLLGEPRYLEAADRAAAFLWARNRRQDGGLWRVHLGGNSSVAATLEDYSYFSEALVSLYDATGARPWLEHAQEVVGEMVTRFSDTQGGGFFMSESDEGGRLIARPKSPTDGAIPSGNSVAVRVLALLATRVGEADYRRQAEATIAAFSQRIRQSPTAFAYMLLGADELLHGGAGPLKYGARGVVRAQAELGGDGSADRELTIRLRIAAGWHVNAHRPLQEFLIPTEVVLDAGAEGFELLGLEYPRAQTVTLGFQQEPLSVYQGDVQIQGKIVANGAAGRPAIARLSLTIQACNDEMCLQPENLALELPIPGGSGGR